MKRFLTCTLVVLLLFGLGMCSGCAQKQEKEAEKEVERKTEHEEKEVTAPPEQISFVLSSAFENEGDIPAKYANKGVTGGENISIPLSWKNAPEGTKSFVVVMIDRHKIANDWIHWLVIDIPGDTNSIPEGASGSAKMPEGAKELDNTFGLAEYGGPQPPPGSGPHDYETTVYALNVENLDLTGEITVSELKRVLEGKILGSAKIVGKFER